MKTPKRSESTKKQKLKLTTPKTPNGSAAAKSSSKAASGAKAAKPKATPKKQTKTKDSEDTVAEGSKPQSVEEQRGKEVSSVNRIQINS